MANEGEEIKRIEGKESRGRGMALRIDAREGFVQWIMR